MSKWINVNDRLPQGQGFYLLCCTNYMMVGTFEYAPPRWYGGEPDGEGDITNCVTHWMPLPEPPVAAPGREKEGA